MIFIAENILKHMGKDSTSLELASTKSKGNRTTVSEATCRDLTDMWMQPWLRAVPIEVTLFFCRFRSVASLAWSARCDVHVVLPEWEWTFVPVDFSVSVQFITFLHQYMFSLILRASLFQKIWRIFFVIVDLITLTLVFVLSSRWKMEFSSLLM